MTTLVTRAMPMKRTMIALAGAAALAGCGNPTTSDANGMATANHMTGNDMAGANVAMTSAMSSPVAAPSKSSRVLIAGMANAAAGCSPG